MMLKRAINFTIGILTGVVITTLLFWLFYNKTKLTVKTEIDIVETLSIFINIGLVLFVAYIIEKRRNISNSEKERFAERIDQFNKKVYDMIGKSIGADSIDYTKSTAAMKVLRTRANSIISYGEEYKLLEKDCKISAEIRARLFELWELLTNDDIDSFAVQLSKIENKLIDTENIIYKLISHVNKRM